MSFRKKFLIKPKPDRDLTLTTVKKSSDVKDKSGNSQKLDDSNECTQTQDTKHEAGNIETYRRVSENTIDRVSSNTNPKPQHENEASVGFPDGLSLDPLSPTTVGMSTDFMDRIGSGLNILKEHGKKVQKYVMKNRKFDILKKSWNSVVTVVLIEAKDLPDGPDNGSNTLYCKFRLGAECYKSKMTTKSCKPSWRERFNLYLYDENNLHLIVWHKGKQKNFMGRCVIDLSRLEKEKTHDLWQPLECGFGEIHLLVTLSGTARTVPTSQLAITNGVHSPIETNDKYAWYKLGNGWTEVGELSVTVHGAKGLSAMSLSGKADAFCVLELDNSRVQTHTIHGTSDPQWNKTYKFEVTDITSTLDIAVYEESIMNSMKGETLGKLIIPLLRINNGEKRWYALKDKTRKRSAKGNCPRILLEMSITWNPIKASLRVLRPKESKYIQKSQKFDIPLIYNNLLFVKNIFTLLYEFNEFIKRLFEWESTERSAMALAVWIVFWLIFRSWMAPLLLLPPFIYYMTTQRTCNPNNSFASIDVLDESTEDEEIVTQKDDKTIMNRIYGLQDLTLTIKNSIDYIVSIVERLKNLCNFTVPYLSYLAISALIGAAFALYIIPFNYLLLALGVYKFMRKYLNPERVPNNDLLDFISRVPDDEILKEWRELKVPEPNLQRNGSIRKLRN